MLRSTSTLPAKRASTLSPEKAIKEVLKRIAILIVGLLAASPRARGRSLWRRLGIDVDDARFEGLSNLAKGVRQLLRSGDFQRRGVRAVHSLRGAFDALLYDSTNKNADK